MGIVTQATSLISVQIISELDPKVLTFFIWSKGNHEEKCQNYGMICPVMLSLSLLLSVLSK